MRDEYGLTPKQRIWADAYLETGNGLEADRRAGYKQRMSDQNRQIPAIKAYIDARLKPAQDQRIASAEEVLQYLTRVMLGEEKDQFGLDASLQDRTKAAQELLKRYAVADDRQRGTMARLDSMFAEFRLAISTPGGDSSPETSARDAQQTAEPPADASGASGSSDPASREA